MKTNLILPRDTRIIQRMHYAVQTVNNSIVLVSSPGLHFYAQANSGYNVQLQLYHQSTATADLRIHFDVPALSTGALLLLTYNGAAYGTVADTLLVGTQGDLLVINISMFLHIDNTPGEVTFQWAQGVAEASDSKVLTGSNLIAFKLS